MDGNIMWDIVYFELVLSYGEHDLNHVLHPRGDLARVKDRPQCLKDSMDTTRAHFNQLQSNLLEYKKKKKKLSSYRGKFLQGSIFTDG